jgi:lysozyme family protein
MADFATAYKIILGIEGGYQSNPNDDGNYACGALVGTNYGISAPTLQDWIGHCPSVTEMQLLEESVAMAIYKARFWDRIRADEITNQNSANMLFDMIVNQTGHFNGIVRDAVIAQRSYVNIFELPFDDNELSVLNSLNQHTLFNDIKDFREAAYRETVLNNPAKGIFLDGWLARLDTLNWDAKYKQPIKFAVVALIIIGLGVAAYMIWNNDKKLKGLLK